jgi:hypothetical protein
LKNTSDCEDVDSGNILKWFAVDCTKPCHLVLADSKIMRQVQGQSGETDEYSEYEDIPLIPEKRISQSSELEWTENLLDYLKQEDALKSDKLALQRLRNRVRTKEATLQQESVRSKRLILIILYVGLIHV